MNSGQRELSWYCERLTLKLCFVLGVPARVVSIHTLMMYVSQDCKLTPPPIHVYFTRTLRLRPTKTSSQFIIEISPRKKYSSRKR